MFVAMPGQQYAKRELSTILKEAAIRRIEAKPTIGYWSVVTGVKPWELGLWVIDELRDRLLL